MCCKQIKDIIRAHELLVYSFICNVSTQYFYLPIIFYDSFVTVLPPIDVSKNA